MSILPSQYFIRKKKKCSLKAKVNMEAKNEVISIENAANISESYVIYGSLKDNKKKRFHRLQKNKVLQSRQSRLREILKTSCQHAREQKGRIPIQTHTGHVVYKNTKISSPIKRYLVLKIVQIIHSKKLVLKTF